MLQLIGQISDIKSAVNAFNSSYHADYDRVRKISRRYLDADVSLERASEEAEALYEALANWGACTRRAPTLRPPHQAAVKLKDKALHARLACLDRFGLDGLDLAAGSDTTFNKTVPFGSVKQFDIELLSILAALADALFINNTNVTYPMKALLLITGFMPALDSQVRKGLQRAGMAGFSGTQYLLPKNAYRAAGRRICDLPFSLARCWHENKDQLIEAVLQSDHPGLSTDPGRIFDILLFMQRPPERCLILSAN
ncbi:hypothetical protein D3C77_479370 [compost metagenome]